MGATVRMRIEGAPQVLWGLLYYLNPSIHCGREGSWEAGIPLLLDQSAHHHLQVLQQESQDRLGMRFHKVMVEIRRPCLLERFRLTLGLVVPP